MKIYSSYIDEKDSSQRRFIRSKNFKFVKYENGEEELYDLRIKEEKVSPKKHPQIFNQLKKRIEMWEESLDIYGKSTKRRRLSDKEEDRLKERLKALGYF